jgi:hypothetical protein
VGDFGLSVSPRLENSPLWTLSPRALRLWIYLAMKANHPPVTVRMPEGERIAVARGEWLTSTRKLKRELHTSASSITADLAVLKEAGVITVRAIPRTKFRNTPVPECSTGGRTKFRNARSVLATLVTVEGLRFSGDPVPDSGTKDKSIGKTATTSPFSARDRRERDLAFAQLTAEGR